MDSYVLVYSGGSMPQTEEEQAAIMKAWTSWFEGLGSSIVDPGNPFTPAAKSIAADGAVSDGSVGTMATGYSIIQADSMDAAVDIAKGCPVLQGGAQISVYQTFQVM